ncbi:MAG: PHP-associated domain-containing protein [Longimicrobiaceae bacterium]
MTRLLRVDLHLHTRASHDCLSDPERVLERARRVGLDRIAVTDHNRISGALGMRELDAERVIVGEEIKTAEGADVIGLFLTECVPKGVPAREACERIRGQGGVVYAPHPFDHKGLGERLLDELAGLIDVVEVHNARLWRRGLNQRASEWARARAKPVGAGSDAHTLREIGRGVIAIPPFKPERESFLAAIHRAQVETRARTTPFCHLWSRWAQVRKKLLPHPRS